MTLVEKVMSIWLPAMVYNDSRNSRRDVDKKTYTQIQKENGGTVAYFNGEWYDVAIYICLAAHEIGNVDYVNEKEHSEICYKYADNFVKNVLSGGIKPTKLKSPTI